jgi:hypothetical protein
MDVSLRHRSSMVVLVRDASPHRFGATSKLTC